MRLKQKFKGAISVLFVLGIVAGCGTAVDEDQTSEEGVKVGEESDSSNAGVVEGSLDVMIENPSDAVYKITIKNDTDKDLPLTFNGGQKYEYQIKDKAGEVLFTYSMNKMFTMEIKEEVLKPGEERVFEDINITEGLTYIEESGTYDVEIWCVAEQVADKKTTFEYVYTGKTSQLDLSAQFITVSDRIDTNTLKVTNDKGEQEEFLLANRFIEDGYEFKEGAKIEVLYSLNESGQKVIEEVIESE